MNKPTQEIAKTKLCPHCYTAIDFRATTCPNCRHALVKQKRRGKESGLYQLGTFAAIIGIVCLVFAVLFIFTGFTRAAYPILICGVPGVGLTVFGLFIRFVSA